MIERDGFARATARKAHEAALELKRDIDAMLMRLSVVENKTANVSGSRCAICGEPTKGRRYCRQHDFWAEDEA